MSAIQKLLTDHIDVWTAADTEKKSGRGRASGGAANVYGIKKLRELILELAVRGKLVPQDPNDEPASELLKRIQAERAKLVVEGKIKKSKQLQAISEEEKLYELPKNWEWARFQQVYDVRDGTHDTPRYCDSGFPLITSKNLYSGELDFSDVKYISEEDHLKIKERSGVNRNDILFAMIGSIGNPVIVDTDIEFSIKNVALLKPYSDDLSNMNFLLKYLLIASVKMRSEAAGAVQSFVSLGILRNYLIALPPLAEQRRIVAKVDELMALCDQLETQHIDAAEAHEKLVSHLLGTLTQSQSAEDFSENWQRIAKHFDTLFTTESSIDVLKQTILQLAVMGKLVPQDPNDEPASELLKRIQAEKAKLVAGGKRRKAKSLPAITEVDKTFLLPLGWEWVRLGQIGDWGAGATPLRSNSAYYGGTMPWFKSGELTADFIDTSEETITDLALKECSLRLNQPGDVLMAMYGATIGKSAILKVHGTTNQAVCACTPSAGIYNRYLLFLLKAMNSNFIGQGAGGAQPNISREKIIATAIAIPPTREQHRIVAKVDELMVLCDQLKTHLAEANQLQQKLANLIVEQEVG
ncbi:MAG: restriction endonuclease subunit S [Pseudohongiellaceae bacterium]|nr:restriction endonuclease subunit S [Pseudohongiellaceae bacterium]